MKRTANSLLLGLALLALQAQAAGKERAAVAATAQNRPASVFRDCGDCPEMVVIPAGSFMMGAPRQEADKAEEVPVHRVTIGKPFAMSTHEISWDEWNACVQARACSAARDEGFGRGRRPVINVSRDDAILYAKWLSEKTGHAYRLPSEAEWEYAARAGTGTARYWGNDDDIACDYANVFNAAIVPYNGLNWYWESFGCNDGYKETAPGGKFKPNAFGLYDMLGNVREWTLDCFREDYANAPADGSARQDQSCQYYVTRGGSWVTEPVYIRAAARYWVEPSNRNDDLGIRLVRALR